MYKIKTLSIGNSSKEKQLSVSNINGDITITITEIVNSEQKMMYKSLTLEEVKEISAFINQEIFGLGE